MRFLFSLVLLFAALHSGAQRTSRIVFFRIDDESIPSRSAYDSWMQRTASLMKDESQIADMGKLSLLVYTDISTRGNYRFATAANGDSVSNVLTLHPTDGSIAFVKISTDGSGPNKTVLQAVSIANFQNYLNEQAWMRKAMVKLGYASIDLLADGFEVLPLVQVLPRRPVLSLSDSVFYDNNGRKAQWRKADWYRFAKQDSAGRLVVTEQYFPGHRMKSRGVYTTLDSESREGYFEGYFRSGALASRGKYRSNRMHGTWEFFRDTTLRLLWYTVEYSDGKQNGMLTSYHLDGSVKRRELRKIFYDTVREYDADPKPRIIAADSLISGICYDHSGREVPFTEMRVMPKAEFGLNDFLNKVLRYPREARARSITGRVVVQFAITAEGAVAEAEVIRHSDPLLEAEALRVIRAMPGWTPGKLDDENIQVLFSLPITFRLD